LRPKPWQCGEVGVVVEEMEAVLDGRLGDQAVDRASDRHAAPAELEEDFCGGSIGFETTLEAMDHLAPQVIAEFRKIPLRGRALEDFEDRERAEAKRKVPLQDFKETADGGIVPSFQETDHDGGVDEDHRALARSFL
jgi:hypothetical protein